MEIDKWIQLGLLLLLTGERVSRWASSREHADTTTARDLQAMKDRHAEDIKAVREQHAEDVAHLNQEIGRLTRRDHELSELINVDRVKIAVLETRVEAEDR